VVVGIVSPGAMGSGLARALAAGGARAVATVDGRGERTRSLARDSGVELLPTLDDVVAAADVVLSVVPPDRARTVAASIAEAISRVAARPIVVDLNAVSPATARDVAWALAAGGAEAVDGSISGPPPRPGGETRIYLSGARADTVAELPCPGVVWRVVGAEVGLASAVKMSTASVYKGTAALLTQAFVAAAASGVLDVVLDDLRRGSPELAEDASARLQSAAAKAARYVGEMREIADAQSAAGLGPALFAAMAEVFETVSASALAVQAPEEIDPRRPLDEVVAALRRAR
jgi:3-hydroxyisobutyrate dehydrogenase-like beta-hydroxyacid dehydrogenase